MAPFYVEALFSIHKNMCIIPTYLNINHDLSSPMLLSDSRLGEITLIDLNVPTFYICDSTTYSHMCMNVVHK